MNTLYVRELITKCIEKNPGNYSNVGQSFSKLPCAVKKTKLIDKNSFQISDVEENFEKLKYIAYTFSQLQAMTKHFKINCSGSKAVIAAKIYFYLYFSFLAKRIQKRFRGTLVRNFIRFFGNALFKRQLCTNVSDFITLEELPNIQFPQFFSYEDTDGFVYGFDFVSIFNLFFQIQATPPKNPYNRQLFPPFVKKNILQIVKKAKLLQIPIQTNYHYAIPIKLPPPVPSPEIDSTELLRQKINQCFQRIQSFPNMQNVSVEWFLALGHGGVQSFAQKLYTIWNERAEIPFEVKKKICFPSGRPFNMATLNLIVSSGNTFFVKRLVIEIIEKFISTGIDDEHCALGGFYIIGTLTMVSMNAATEFPWLFDSFSNSIEN